MAVRLADGLNALPGMEGVRVNPRTGSILLLYTLPATRKAALTLLDAAPASLPSVEEQSREDICRREKPDVLPLLRYVLFRPFMPLPLRVVGALRRGVPFLLRGGKSLLGGRLNVDVLDAAAIGVSLVMRDFGTAGLLTLLLAFGESLEAWTRKKSLGSLAERLALTVTNIWVRREGKEIHIPIDKLQAGDFVVVRSGSAIPVDGRVVEGEASVNQAYMTGEALGVLRSPGNFVFAGTAVEEGELIIEPTGVGRQTRFQQIMRFIDESEARKAGIQGKMERLSDAVVPFTFLLAALVLLATRNPMRAAGVLMVDYSCALKLATPLAILTAIREGAGRGVLIKGGRFLEVLAQADAVIFDKTGTLTESRPRVGDVVPARGRTREEVLRLAACLEEHFPHPVARAVVRRAEEERLQHQEEHAEVKYIVAHGIASTLRGQRVFIGSRHYIEQDEGISVDSMLPEAARLTEKGQSILYLAIDEHLAGIIGIEDPLRPESAGIVKHLREQGITRILMLTGDDEGSAAAVARCLDIKEYLSQVLPADKADIVKNLKADGYCVIMVGDGINDSPALSAADAGITLRDGADLAREVADVVLTRGSLGELVAARELGRRTMNRVHFNFAAAVGLNSLYLVGSLVGILSPGSSAILHNLTTLGVCLNAMRPLFPQGEGRYSEGAET